MIADTVGREHVPRVADKGQGMPSPEAVNCVGRVASQWPHASNLAPSTLAFGSFILVIETVWVFVSTHRLFNL